MFYSKREAYYERSQYRGKSKYFIRAQNTTHVFYLQSSSCRDQNKYNYQKIERNGYSSFQLH